MRQAMKLASQAYWGGRGQKRRAQRERYAARSDREWQRARRDEIEAEAIVKDARGDAPRLRKRYEKLVLKYGR